MTPAQQATLEACARRPLTQADIDVLDPLLAVRNDGAIAAHLSVGRVKVVPTPIGPGTVMSLLTPNGGDFLNAIEALGAVDANAKWSMWMIKNSTFDVGHPATRAQLPAFAAAHPEMASAVAVLLAAAERDDPIHYNEVSDKLNIAEGRLTMGAFINGQ